MLGVLLIAATAPGLKAESLGEIADRLSAAAPYHASARYEVLLPQSEDPVVYNISLYGYAPAQPDSLAPCNYLIDWELDTPSGPSEGFSAYFDGHHYRFRDKRLQEYHHDDSAAPFSAQGRVEMGVQQQAQFASLLPAFVAARLREIESDPACSYTVRTTDRGISVEGEQSYDGVTGMEFRYVFDSRDSRPLLTEICYNPDHMSEQTVTVRYLAPTVDATDAPLSEPALMALYPEAFGRYRESTYTLENLPGRPLPAISAQCSDGSRFVRSTGQEFASPTVLAILDADVEDCAETVAMLRRAVDSAPVAAQLILAFTGGHADAVAGITGTPRADEVVLTGARGLARDCGATSTPTIVVCGRDGVVKNVHNGRNKDLASVVMQEISI